MAVKELLAKHGVDNAELMTAIEGLLATAESKNTDGIPQSRFNQVVKERNDLRADLAEKQSEIDQLKAKVDGDAKEITRLKSVETKFNDFKTAEETKVLNAWSEKAKVFSVPDSDPTFEKVEKIRGKFKFPGKDETLTAEQAQHNLEIFNVIEETGYFGKINPLPDETPAHGSPTFKKGKDPLDALDKL